MSTMEPSVVILVQEHTNIWSTDMNVFKLTNNMIIKKLEISKEDTDFK